MSTFAELLSRVLHHIKAFGSDPKNTIVLAGYQAAGTRGDSLQRGDRAIKIHGEYVDVRAEIKVLENISAHADYSEILNWLSQSKISPKKVFITHGEPKASDDLRRRIQDQFGWDCYVPSQDEEVTLS